MARSSEAPRRLIPPGARVAVVALVLSALVVVSVVGTRYAGTSHPGTVDRWADRALHNWPDGLRVLVLLGDPIPMVIGIVVLTVLAARFARAGLFALLSPPLAVITTFLLLKPIVGRTLGDGVGYAYPSTHMTGVTALVVVAVVLVAARWRQSPWRWPAFLLLAVVAIAESLTLSALGLHYVTDTLGGACVAIGVVLTCALARDSLVARAHRLRLNPSPSRS
ncbi:phosphatase PAP2 family protein [Actinomycetospora sp. C-140]